MDAATSPIEPLKAPKPIKWWMALIVLGAITGISALVYLWLWSQVNSVPPLDPNDITYEGQVEIARLRVEIIRNALTVAAGLGGLAALALAFRRQFHAEHQQRHHEHATRLAHEQREREQQQREEAADAAERDALERRITDMRIQAIEQLGSENSTVRIGGLHNLERIGSQYVGLRQIVIDEICTYLRMSARSIAVIHSPAAGESLSSTQFEPVGPPPPTVRMADRNHLEQEREVCLVAQSILERHLNREDSPDEYWQHRRLNLTGATLSRADFQRCELHGADFSGVRFEGGANFAETQFVGDASFVAAVFYGSVNFIKATFHRVATFFVAHFTDSALFTDSTFKLAALFEGAYFQGTTWFAETDFEYNVFFGSCHFREGVGFNDCTIRGKAAFDSTAFLLDYVSPGTTFPVATFRDGSVSFAPDKEEHYDSLKDLGWKIIPHPENSDLSKFVEITDES